LFIIFETKMKIFAAAVLYVSKSHTKPGAGTSGTSY
jgi:hypothetical protein